MPRYSTRKQKHTYVTKQNKPSTPASQHTFPNQQQQPSFASTITQGVGLGTGVAIGNTLANAAADKIFGNEPTTVNTDNNHIVENPKNCLFEYNDFKNCMIENNSNIELCQMYKEMLNICRKDVLL